MYLPKIFKYLNDNEIAGAETINPIVDFLRGIRSTSDFIELNPNSNGSMNIGLDVDSLANYLRQDVDVEELQHTFKATITSGSSYTISGGTVYFGHDKAFSVSSSSGSGTGSYYVQCTSSGASIQSGTVSHVLNPTNQTVNLPLFQAYNDDGIKFRYYHIGNWAFTDVPYFWIAGYDKTKEQILTHSANTDGLLWQDVAPCDE